VTIIAGFRGYDGIVLCSDTQETTEHSKRKVSKLRIEPSDGKSEIAVAFCGAGDNGPFIDKAISVAWEDVQTATSLDEASAEIEKSLKRTYKEYGQIYQRGHCPHAELIYGIKMHGSSKLFHASGPVVNEKIYSSAGIGQYMADFLSSRMFKDYLDIQQLQIIAAYILFQAKEHVDGCGGDSEIAILRNDGRSGRVDSSHVEKITELLSYSDSELAQALLSCADLKMSKRTFRKRLRNTVKMIEMFRDNSVMEHRRMQCSRAVFFGMMGSETDDLGIPKPFKPMPKKYLGRGVMTKTEIAKALKSSS
jgi:20S proteasome alpha/beta subunit